MNEFWRIFFLHAAPAAIPGLTLLLAACLLNRQPHPEPLRPLTPDEEKILRMLTRRPTMPCPNYRPPK